MIIAPGSEDVTRTIYAHDKLTDAGKTGLVAADINAYFSRVETDNDVTKASITVSDLSTITDAHSDGGLIEIDSTNMKGHYRFDYPDTVCATGAVEANLSFQDAGDNNFIIMPTKIELNSGLPEKNKALSNIEFLMVDSTDFATPETGLTVTGTRSIDGGSFASVSGTIAEVGNGIYQFDAVAADMNGGIITFRFSATGAADMFITIRTNG